MQTVQTNRKVVTIGMLFGEDDWEEFRHIKGFRVCIVCLYVNGRQKNEQPHKKNENERAQMDVDNWFTSKCKQVRNEPKTAEDT